MIEDNASPLLHGWIKKHGKEGIFWKFFDVLASDIEKIKDPMGVLRQQAILAARPYGAIDPDSILIEKYQDGKYHTVSFKGLKKEFKP